MLAVILAPSAAPAATYSSRALIENARLLDGKKVAYRGEAVTAIMKRGDHAWVNVKDGDSTIGVWARADLLADIAFLGDYKHKGDIVQVEGFFNRACAMHGGSLDIHAHGLRVVKPGFPIKERLSVGTAYLAGALFFMTLIVTAVFRRRI